MDTYEEGRAKAQETDSREHDYQPKVHNFDIEYGSKAAAAEEEEGKGDHPLDLPKLKAKGEERGGNGASSSMTTVDALSYMTTNTSVTEKVSKKRIGRPQRGETNVKI